MNKITKTKPKKGHRIALYIRVSTEEQASNPEGSIKSQEQRLRTLVDLKNLDSHFGEVTGVYVDRARSGKDTNRPELQRLLQGIRNQEVTLVMVSELSRLSRSIKDFCEIWELMRANGCEFQSLREQFDTTTAAGEMVLYTIANIAQFERKQTSERISANFRARAERGLTNGGPVPFGYSLDPEKKGHLKVDPESAPIVQEAFKAFIKEGSLSKTGMVLNDKGHRITRKRQGGGNRARLGHFTVDNLHDLLTNKAYIGLRSYWVEGEERTSKAVWEPIVNQDLFAKVQKTLKKNHRRLKSQYTNRFPYLLSGLVSCGQCHDALSGKSANGNGGKIPYYEHSWATKRQACLTKKFFDHEPRRILAKVIEPLIWKEVERLFLEPEVAKSLIEEAHKVHQAQGHVKDADKLRSRVRGIEEQLDALAEHLAKIPKTVSPTPIYNQMEKLEGLKTESRKELDKVMSEGHVNDLPVPLCDYQAYLATIRQILEFSDAVEIRAKILERLVQKVEVFPGTFKIHFFVGKSVIVPIDWDPGPPGPGKPPKNKKDVIKKGGQPKKGAALNFLLDTGSKTLTSGGSARGRTVDLYHVKVIQGIYLPLNRTARFPKSLNI